MGFHFFLSLSMELAVTQNSYYYFIFICFLNLDPFKPLFILPLSSKWDYLILSCSHGWNPWSRKVYKIL
ncbi:unnamed protein product [Lactuca virosa]|uniref:Uncharacterized protein n=1 Tax=Lactuca virosa TaxID=75947 RepID=A0AAU9PFR0_9ASTR|nr:unnamed protein product [Lactuca virosa]